MVDEAVEIPMMVLVVGTNNTKDRVAVTVPVVAAPRSHRCEPVATAVRWREGCAWGLTTPFGASSWLPCPGEGAHPIAAPVTGTIGCRDSHNSGRCRYGCALQRGGEADIECSASRHLAEIVRWDAVDAVLARRFPLLFRPHGE